MIQEFYPQDILNSEMMSNQAVAGPDGDLMAGCTSSA